jgi:predicted RNA binding protein YcfA (HicA-like mRNA interferase family)
MKSEIWSQLKNITASELISALENDGWGERASGGSAVVFKKSGKKVVIHLHPHKTFGPKQLKELFKDIGWTAHDLKRLRLIK